LVAALTLYTNNPAVEARPLRRRGCYNGGKAAFTNYWVPRQGDKDQDNDGNKMRLSGDKDHAMRDPSGKTIAMVDDNTYEKCDMEGTCVINHKGKDELINLANGGGKNAKFDFINKNRPFGQGSEDNPLEPFASVAVNDLEIGTTLYIGELDGMKLPNGLIHNGCVVVADEGWSFDGCQVDLFVVSYANYLKMNTPERVKVQKKKCKVLKYATAGDYTFVGAKVPSNLPKSHRKGPKGSKTPKPEEDPKEEKKEKKEKKKGPKGGASTKSCDSGETYCLTYSNTDFGGSETCSAGSGCHNLSGVTKSSKWSSGSRITFYKSSDCTGETVYSDSIGEDANISGDGSGFNAGSVSIE
jgi:hypothetical protein